MARLALPEGQYQPQAHRPRQRLFAVGSVQNLDNVGHVTREKVDKLCSIDCSSPDVRKNLLENGCTTTLISQNWKARLSHQLRLIPRVLSMTVLPPVLGPVMTMAVRSSSKRKSLATGLTKSG